MRIWNSAITIGVSIALTSAVTAQQRAAGPSTPATMKPVASIKQIMLVMAGPSSKTLFEAVATIQTRDGTEERAPHTDEEWAVVQHAAITLAESGNLLMIGSRVKDRGRWLRMAREMIDAAEVALKAADLRDPAALLASGERIYLSCDACHEKYQPRAK